MTILSDVDIFREIEEGNLVIKPYEGGLLQPASYDFRLSGEFRVFNYYNQTCIDPSKQQRLTTHIQSPEFVIHPGEFVLASSTEWWEFPRHIVGRLEGKSSLGRLGLIVHATAGYFDPGFQGTATIELANVSRLPIILRAGMKIGQMAFEYLSSPSGRMYGDRELASRYQGQTEPTESRVSLRAAEVRSRAAHPASGYKDTGDPHNARWEQS